MVTQRDSSDLVILLHGLAAHRMMMGHLAQSMVGANYRVLNWGYRSITQPIETLAKSFAARLQSLQTSPTRIHIVAHSMGSIIARRALQLQHGAPLGFGRFVMLAPPNAGSPVAHRLADKLGWLCPPLRELSDFPESYVNQLDPSAPVETGIIAAGLDRVVRLHSTYLSGAKDHIVLPSHHTALLWREDTADQTLHFLRHGQFAT
ncbi:MAG: alpha/beta fold hydrolase [Planctomycetota bacterium]